MHMQVSLQGNWALSVFYSIIIFTLKLFVCKVTAIPSQGHEMCWFAIEYVQHMTQLNHCFLFKTQPITSGYKL